MRGKKLVFLVAALGMAAVPARAQVGRTVAEAQRMLELKDEELDVKQPPGLGIEAEAVQLEDSMPREERGLAVVYRMYPKKEYREGARVWIIVGTEPLKHAIEAVLDAIPGAASTVVVRTVKEDAEHEAKLHPEEPGRAARVRQDDAEDLKGKLLIVIRREAKPSKP